ncbi:MAG: hypothetical protein KF819_13230 [Labilithrix sp.]|nr:hypothetical protein [Labilithrix sp.]
MRRTGFVLGAAALGLGLILADERADADGVAPVHVSLAGTRRVRVQITEGGTLPCDSADNRKLFDGFMSPGETFHGRTAGECVCVRNTRPPFTNVDWSTSQLACRPRVCRGRVCRPLPDPTIRAVLSGS